MQARWVCKLVNMQIHLQIPTCRDTCNCQHVKPLAKERIKTIKHIDKLVIIPQLAYGADLGRFNGRLFLHGNSCSFSRETSRPETWMAIRYEIVGLRLRGRRRKLWYDFKRLMWDCQAADGNYRTIGSNFDRIYTLRNIVFSIFIDVEIRIRLM